MTDEFAWMDAPALAVEAPKKRRAKKGARKASKKAASKPARKDVAPKIESAKKLPLDKLRGKAMFQSVKGRKRTWACDGEYVFFRRKNCYGKDPVTGETIKNHAAISRHERFLQNGDYTYVATYDDVEVCRVNEQSALHRKGRYLGGMSDGDVQRQCVLAACRRDWVLYVDALTEYAGRIKGGKHPAFATAAWDEHLAYVHARVAARGGPTPAEMSAGMQNVRVRRGESSGRRILLPAGRA